MDDKKLSLTPQGFDITPPHPNIVNQLNITPPHVNDNLVQNEEKEIGDTFPVESSSSGNSVVVEDQQKSLTIDNTTNKTKEGTETVKANNEKDEIIMEEIEIEDQPKDKSKIGGEEEKTVDEETRKSLLKKRKLCGLVEGSDSIDNYFYLNKIHEGVYGIVFRGKDKISNEIVAIKKVKLNKDVREGFPITSIREINILLSIKHPNIVNLKEVVIGSSLDKIYVVMEYMEHELKDLMDNVSYTFSQAEVKNLMKQLLSAMEYLHSKNILHRDLKPSNLLYSNKGILKLCDFGLARKYLGNKPYTPTVVTLWYRAPEILLGQEKYSLAIDMWSVGCIFAELILREPLFVAKAELEQIDTIFKLTGTPTEENWPRWKELKNSKNIQFKKYLGNKIGDKFKIGSNLSESGLHLLKEMLTLDPDRRITASKALKHQWFKESPPPQDIDLMPTFKPMNEVSRDARKKLKMQQKD